MDEDDKAKLRTALCLRAPKANEDGTFGIVGSDETQDSHGDRLRVKGWDLTRFSGRKNGGVPSRKGNPVIMWAHDYEVPPVGKAVLVTKDLAAPSLDFKVKFMEEEEFGGASNWPATAPTPIGVHSMVEAGILRGSSVGFIPGEFKALELAEGEKGSVNLGFFEPRDYIKGHVLMELSIAPIPSNPSTLVEAFSKGWIKRAHLPQMLKALQLCKRSLNLSAHGLGDDLCELIAKEVGAPRVGVELPGITHITTPCRSTSEELAELDHNTLASCQDSSNFRALGPKHFDANAAAENVAGLIGESLRSIIREEMARAFALDDEDDEAEEPAPERRSKVTSKGQEAIFDALLGVTDPS